MTLAPGSRLGVYEIRSKLGEGGMGEVYRARDSKLNRDVAIKVLPAAVAADHERLARFTREAQTLAALNHPNIATIYGIEESAGVRALVMELVEGDDLSMLIARGPIAPGDALPLARQVAEALEAAHEIGIVHRDLKPANIKVRTDGTVKVLDFGLAKAMDVVAAGSADALNSPTLTAALGTEAGIILGTAAYMAPEQAKGRPVDRRADIWAFGVVLFEMLTGTRLFDGETVSDVLAAVLTHTPNWAALPAGTPPAVRRLLERCLERDVKLRLRDIGEARILLARPEEAASRGVVQARARRLTPSLLLSCAACLAGGAALAWWLRAPSPSPTPLRLAVSPLVSARAHAIYTVRISPDGRRVVYWDDASPQLVVRDLDSFDNRPLAGTEGGRNPFFSPDGEWVGFYAAGKLRKVPVQGGDAVTICDVPTESPGADWGPDGTIYYSPTWTSGLWKVSSSGGQPSRVTEPDRAKGEGAHFWPRVLPGGRRVLFTIFGGLGLADARIGLLDAQSGRVDVLLPGSRPVYLESGRLAFFHGGAYHVVPFDAAAGTIGGAPERLSEPIRPLDPSANAESYLDASRVGRVVYVPGESSRRQTYSRPVWIDRHGRKTTLPFADYHQSLAMAPDGHRAAVARSAGGDLQVWVYDLERGTRDQLTRDGSNFDPAWSADGTRVAYTSLTKTGSFDVRWSPADGSGSPSVLVAGPQDDLEWKWLPDARSGIFTTIAPQTGKDICTLTEGQPTSRRCPIASPVDDELPEVSPDGRFIVWVSAGTVYAARYPSITGRIQLAARATSPSWSGATSDLVFVQDGWLVTLPYEVRGDTLVPGTPVTLFAIPPGPADVRFSVSSDGQRFLMLENDPAHESPEEIRVLDSLP